MKIITIKQNQDTYICPYCNVEKEHYDFKIIYCDGTGYGHYVKKIDDSCKPYIIEKESPLTLVAERYLNNE